VRAKCSDCKLLPNMCAARGRVLPQDEVASQACRCCCVSRAGLWESHHIEEVQPVVQRIVGCNCASWAQLCGVVVKSLALCMCTCIS
jgi:hypothetical protein